MTSETVPTYVAFHEAGHAIVAVAEKIGFRSVTIERTEHALGRLLFAALRIPATVETPSQRDRLERLVRVILAGRIAQCRHDEKSYEEHTDEEDRRALEMILPRLCERSEPVLDAYLKYLEADAVDTIDQCWPEVERCAQELLRSRKLSASAVKKILYGV